MTNIKKHIITGKYILSVLLITIAIIASGCSSSPPDGTVEYSDSRLKAALEECISSGEESFAVQFFSDGNEVENNIDNFMNSYESSSYIAACLLEDFSIEYNSHPTYTEALFNLTYKDSVKFTGKIQEASGKEELESAMIERFSSDTGKAAFLLKDCAFSDDEIMAVINSAEINCASVPCEAENISCASFEPENGMQLIIAWVEFPVNNTTLSEKTAELAESTDKILSELSLSDKSSVRDSFSAVFNMVIKQTEYDDTLASATLTGSHSLTSDMHINRSAYGSLVTGKTVCTGYAKAYKLICDRLSLPCRVVTGTKNGVSHAWNAVNIEDETLYVDCTAADTGGSVSQSFLFTESQAKNAGYVFDSGQ